MMLRILQIILAAALFVPFPIVPERASDGSFAFGVKYAHADKGRGGGDDDDDDDDDDDSDDDDDDDDDDEPSGNSGSGSSNSGSSNNSSTNSNSTNSNSGNSNSTRGNGAVANLRLRYSNGWDEQILNGQYRLIDPKGRTVAKRRATQEDLKRMRALVGQ